MDASLYTGGSRDYVQLTAETVGECTQLVKIATSPLLKQDQIFLDVGETLRLRIYVSAVRKFSPDELARINAAHDEQA
jgi:hypothetical protein